MCVSDSRMRQEVKKRAAPRPPLAGSNRYGLLRAAAAGDRAKSEQSTGQESDGAGLGHAVDRLDVDHEVVEVLVARAVGHVFPREDVARRSPMAGWVARQPDQVA